MEIAKQERPLQALPQEVLAELSIDDLDRLDQLCRSDCFADVGAAVRFLREATLPQVYEALQNAEEIREKQRRQQPRQSVRKRSTAWVPPKASTRKKSKATGFNFWEIAGIAIWVYATYSQAGWIGVVGCVIAPTLLGALVTFYLPGLRRFK